jgi:hypothetical protein
MGRVMVCLDWVGRNKADGGKKGDCGGDEGVMRGWRRASELLACVNWLVSSRKVESRAVGMDGTVDEGGQGGIVGW